MALVGNLIQNTGNSGVVGGDGNGSGSGSASTTTVNTTGFDVNKDTNLQSHLASNDTALSKIISTGLSEGGEITIEGGINVGSTIAIAAGKGQIYDDSVIPVEYYPITFSSASGLTLSPGRNWVYVDNTNTIQIDHVEPTSETLKTRLYLWRVVLSSGVISGYNFAGVLTRQYAVTLKEIGKQVGVRRNEVNTFLLTASGANLNFKRTAGKLFSIYSGYPDLSALNDTTYIEFDTANPGDEIQHRLPDNTSPTGDTSFLDVGFYRVGNVRTAIPNPSSNLGVYYIWQFPGPVGNVRATYADDYYGTFEEARVALDDIAAQNSAPESFREAFLIGAIIAQKNETDLNNATFVQTNQAGSFSGGAVSAIGGATTLQNAYQNSAPNSELVTNAVNGAVAYREGQGDNTLPVFQIQNGSGTVTFSVNGNGYVQGSVIQAGTGSNTSAVDNFLAGNNHDLSGSQNFITGDKVTGSAGNSFFSGNGDNISGSGLVGVGAASTINATSSLLAVNNSSIGGLFFSIVAGDSHVSSGEQNIALIGSFANAEGINNSINLANGSAHRSQHLILKRTISTPTFQELTQTGSGVGSITLTSNQVHTIDATIAFVTSSGLAKSFSLRAQVKRVGATSSEVSKTRVDLGGDAGTEGFNLDFLVDSANNRYSIIANSADSIAVVVTADVRILKGSF